MTQGEATQAQESEPASPEADSTSETPETGTGSEIINGEKRWLDRLFGKRRGSKPSIRDDLSDALTKEGAAVGDFTPEERQMLHNILRLQDVRVEDLMIPRAEIEAVELTTTLGELLTLFESSGHSRMPVYNDSLDDPKGMIHIRDVLGYITRTSTIGRKRTKDNARTVFSVGT